MLERLEHVAQTLGLLDGVQDECRDALQGDLDEDAEGAEPEGDGGEQLAVLVLVDGQELPVGSDEGRARDLGGDAAEPGAGAVRAGGDRAGDGLAVDVAEVGHRQAVWCEQPRNIVQARARAQRHAAAFTVGRDETREIGEVQQHAGGDGDPGEAVAGADGLDLHAVLRSGLHRPLHGGGRVGELGAQRTHLFGAPPVLPRPSKTGHRNDFPSPRYVGASPIRRSPSTT